MSSVVAGDLREPMRQILDSTAARPAARLRPLNDPRQVDALSQMGISVLTLPDGRVQLLYTTNTVSICHRAQCTVGLLVSVFNCKLPDIGFESQVRSTKQIYTNLGFSIVKY
ncbi:jg475 [Pararge aegeria aegeria]|uniref:Jg475 protein n=1 Tax=Pararge aegeria aegeria TaxID=348720 RepID=A0A8S4QP32_9NEOP|nr:jg475 [Pararge aegeria aegeria]